ncbi:hypothetical protein ACFXBB_13620 [Streptomyces scopuliridis]|uniref:hypothetical protein n=1 Tax=Streptomyces TaxID=1883 RepID=UPI00342C69D5
MNLYVSLMRTGVPLTVGWLVALAAAHGLELDATAVSGVVAPAASFVYYAVLRFAEQHISQRFGWLLGYASPPGYAGVKQ